MATFFKEDKTELSSKPVLKVNDKQKTELATGFFSLKNGDKGKKIIGGILDPTYNKRREGKKTQGLKADEIAFGDAKKMVHDFEEIASENPKDPSYVAVQPILKNVKDGIKKTRQRYGNMPQAPQPPKPPSKRSKTSIKPNTEVKPVKPNSITESRDNTDHPYYEYIFEYSPRRILEMYKDGDTCYEGLINPDSYKQALSEFIKYGQLVRFPKNKIFQWFGTIMRNTAILRSVNALSGRDVSFPTDEFLDVFFYDDEIGDVNYDAWNEYKEEIGVDDDYRAADTYLGDLDPSFYDWAVMPDGSVCCTDFGLEPLEKIISEYDENKTAEEVLVLLNKALDVTHWQGDLSSIFIVGGKNSLSRISEEVKRNKKTVIITETQLLNIKKALLKEFYKGDLFHSTTLAHLWSILKDNCIYSNEDCDDAYGVKGEFVSLSRTGNPKICYKKTSIPCIITMDAETLMNRSRNGRLKPYNFFHNDKNVDKHKHFEFEERFYGNIDHLSGLAKSIDIYVNNIDECDYDYCDEVEEAYDDLQNQGIEEPSDREINMWFLTRIMNDFPLFKDIIHVHGNI